MIRCILFLCMHLLAPPPLPLSVYTLTTLGFELISGDEVNRPTRRPSAPAMEAAKVEAILRKDKRKSRVKSWFGGFKS